MLQWAVGVFAIGAVGGLVLASSVLRERLPSWGLSLLHAALVVFGDKTAPQGASIALLLLAIAALGGFYLASHHLRKHPGPKTVVVIHAGVAVVGFLLLANGAFGLV
jgi:hypothetical protein